MEAIISRIGQLIIDNNRHKLYRIPWPVVEPLIKKWSRNRDPDVSRVHEMAEHVKSGGYLPPLIHVAEIPGEGLVCYDGNHRRECFKLVSPSTDVLLDIMFSATQKEVYEAFDNLNKCVQVPAIYMEEHNENIHDVREQILEIVKQLEKKYKNYMSTSVRCRAPHFNRDRLTDNLYNIWTHFNGHITIKQIKDALTELNHLYSKEQLCRPHSTYGVHVIKKCSEKDLWLFIDKDIPVEHIRSVLKI